MTETAAKGTIQAMGAVKRLLNSDATERDLLWTLLVHTIGGNVNVLKCPFKFTARDLLYTLTQNGIMATSFAALTGSPSENAALATSLADSSKLIQAVAVAPKTDTATGVNNTYAAVYSGTITLQKANSRVIAFCAGGIAGTSAHLVSVQLQRGGVALAQGAAPGSRVPSQQAELVGGTANIHPFSIVGSDVPGSIGAKQYDLAIRIEAGGTWFLNRTVGDNDNGSFPRTATTMFLLEVAP